MDRAAQAVTLVSRFASSASLMFPFAVGTTLLFTARMGSISLSRYSFRTVFPAAGVTV